MNNVGQKPRVAAAPPGDIRPVGVPTTLTNTCGSHFRHAKPFQTSSGLTTGVPLKIGPHTQNCLPRVRLMQAKVGNLRGIYLGGGVSVSVTLVWCPGFSVTFPSW